MAVDTSNKRGSVIGLDLISLSVLPMPDAAITIGDREHLTNDYAFDDSVSTGATDGGNIVILLRRRR